jgi:1,2-phenylacetyl-CoA epoxidase PaaB subunit
VTIGRFSALAALVAASCAPVVPIAVGNVVYFSSERPYLKRVESFPTPHQGPRMLPARLVFTLPDAETEAAWARATAFVRRYGEVQLAVEDASTIRTYEPSPMRMPMFGYGNPVYAYAVTRKPLGNGVTEFDVECWVGKITNMDPPDEEAMRVQRYARSADGRARILAWYMVSGELRADFLRRFYP